MKKFELVIFDCDGVLVNSEIITGRVFAALLAELGLELSLRQVQEQFIGLSLAQCLARITEMLGAPPPAWFLPELRQRAGAALLAEVAPNPGVAEALAQIPIPACVASSGEPEKVRLVLGHTGLLPRFGANVFTAADVQNPKPAPDLFLHAARQNGILPQACAVIEDSPAGVRAGVAAGMTVFGFAAHTPAQQLKEAGAHVIFFGMDTLPALLTQPAI